MTTATEAETGRLMVQEYGWRFWVATYCSDDGVWVQVGEGETEAEARSRAVGYLDWARAQGITP